MNDVLFQEDSGGIWTSQRKCPWKLQSAIERSSRMESRTERLQFVRKVNRDAEARSARKIRQTLIG